MIRRSVSTGALRAAAQRQPQLVSPMFSPTSQGGVKQQSASLVSAVLLSSQHNWKGETVATLKLELKRRGLSQTGNKNTLVARISSADTSSLLPPVPSISNPTLAKTSRILRPQARRVSTSNPGPSVDGHDHISSTGPDIVSQRVEAPKTAKVTPEQVTSAPGLPIKQRIIGEDKLDIRFPSPAKQPEIAQIIPVVPDNFAVTATDRKTTPSASPKVMTVASASTHPAGGPVHGVHDAADSHAHELEEPVEASPLSFQHVLESVLSVPREAWFGIGAGLHSIGLPETSQQDHQASSRPLNGEERRGAWILAGTVAGAITLSGFTQ